MVSYTVLYTGPEMEINDRILIYFSADFVLKQVKREILRGDLSSDCGDKAPKDS